MPLLFALSLIVTSELSIHPAKVEEFLALVNDGLEVSRSFSGNLGFDIYVEKEKPATVFFIEQWESPEHFQRYYLWRLDRGDFESLEPYFSSPPVLRRFNRASNGSSE